VALFLKHRTISFFFSDHGVQTRCDSFWKKVFPISCFPSRRDRIPDMLRAFISGKKSGRFLVLLSLLPLCSVAASAQQPTKVRPPGVPRQIILAPKLIAGAPAMLAVLDSRGRLMPKVEVEISGGQKTMTDVTGRGLFIAANQPGPMTAKIEGLGVTASANVVSPENLNARGSPMPLSVQSYPRVMTQHDRFILEGTGFRNAADSNHISLNGEPCLVVASSPVSLVVLPGPRVAVGEAQLKIVADGANAGAFPISVVALEFSGPATAVDAGSTGKLILHARGTELPLIVEIRNGSPKVIRLAQGNVQRIKTSGGADNIAPVEVNFVTDGNYLVLARLISVDTHRN
jgi:hypothetical protein